MQEAPDPWNPLQQAICQGSSLREE